MGTNQTNAVLSKNKKEEKGKGKKKPKMEIVAPEKPFLPTE